MSKEDQVYVVDKESWSKRRAFSITVSLSNRSYEDYHALIAYQEWANRRATLRQPVLEAVLTLGRELDSQHEQLAGRDLRLALVVSGEISKAVNQHLYQYPDVEVTMDGQLGVLIDLAKALAEYLDATDVVVSLDDKSFRLKKVPD